MSQERIDLLALMEGRDDGAGALPVQEGDLIDIVAETELPWLPAIFGRDSSEELQEWSDQVRAKLREAGLETAIISADVFDREDGYRQLELELQVAFVGLLPVQLDETGEFWGYDDAGNLLTRAQWERQRWDKYAIDGGFAGTVGGSAFGWSLVALGVGALFVTTYGITKLDAWVSSPESRESIEEVSDAAKTISVAAAIVALVFLLRKA